MEVESPREAYGSPPAGARFSPFSSADSCTYTCPSAPRKPHFRQESAMGNFDKALRYARDVLEDLTEDERSVPLTFLPRGTLEGVFLAFCHYQVGTQQGLEFKSLLALAPCLEQQLLEQVQRWCPSLTWDEWAAHARQAVADSQAGAQLAARVMTECFPSRRLLF